MAFRGEDALDWLQGQLSQDLRTLEPGGAVSSAMASPTGMLEGILRLGRLEDEIVAVTEAPEALLRRVEELVIMEDVAARLLPGDVWTWQGVPQDGPLCRREEGALWLWNPRSPEGGWDTVGAEPGPAGDEEELHGRMLEAGIPLWGVDAGPRTLVPELGPAFVAGHVSHSKGCYTGQEIIHRIHARGHTNRTWTGLLLDGEAAPGTPLFADGEEAGRILRVSCRPNLGWIGSALIKNRFCENGQNLNFGSGNARVCQMPLASRS